FGRVRPGSWRLTRRRAARRAWEHAGRIVSGGREPTAEVGGLLERVVGVVLLDPEPFRMLVLDTAGERAPYLVLELWREPDGRLGLLP
ncbi:hypothetical protein, partial [Actinocorallia lasiicapitis]